MYCGDSHDLVCDLCHPDAHTLANLPEGLKKVLREEPVDNQPTFRLFDLGTVDAARGRLIEVMEKMVYAGKIDDGVTFTNLLEKQLKPLLRIETRVRKAELEKLTEEFKAAIEPVMLEYATALEKLVLQGGKIREIFVDIEKERMMYKWETEDVVHQSEWYPFMMVPEEETS